MILTIFRPKRTKNGKAHVASSYRGRYRLDGEERITDIPLHTTDKRVARERLEKIVREKQLESLGILPPEAIRSASQAPLEKHLTDYVADLQAVARDGQYIYELKNRVRRLMRECAWSQIKDVTSDSFQEWRAKQSLAPKTVNEYLTSTTSLLNWMEKHERIDEFIDPKGRRADFHSLRHTLGTNLALAGTAPRVAMEAMRHSDIRLTTKIYTDTGLLPVSDAVAQGQEAPA